MDAAASAICDGNPHRGIAILAKEVADRLGDRLDENVLIHDVGQANRVPLINVKHDL